MGTKKSGRRIWRIFSPLLIMFAIITVVSTATSMAFVVGNMDKYSALLEAGNQTALAEQLQKQVKAFSDYAGLISIITAMVAIPIMVILFVRDEKYRKTNNIIQRKVGGGSWIIYVIPFAVATAVLLNNLFTLSHISEISASYEQVAKSQFALPLPVQLIGFGILTPISEELIFRGLIYKRMLEEQYTIPRAIVLSSLLFAIFHGNSVQGFYGFLLGVLFAYVYEKTKSIWAPIISHIVANVAAILLSKLSVFQWLFKEPIRMGVVSILCAFVASSMFVVISKKYPAIPITSRSKTK